MIANFVIATAFIIMAVTALYLFTKIKMTNLNLQFKLKKCGQGHIIKRRSADAVIPGIGSDCQRCLQEKVEQADRQKMVDNRENFEEYKDEVQFTVRPITQ